MGHAYQGLAKFFLAVMLIICNSSVFADGSILKTSSEFTFKEAAGFGAEEPYSQVWHYKNSTYLVWVDEKLRAQVTQVTNGVAVTVPLDAQPDYLVQADGHHRFSLGIDKTGYVHITGDMHHYSDLSTGVITPYPARYQRKKILYWRSNKPEDISGGFSFRGDSFDTAIPGGGWILGRFFTDNNGELFYSSHVHAYEASDNKGQMAVGLYKFNATTQTWVSIGGLASKTDPYLSHLYPVFYWENSGMSGGWFQNYQASFKFDKANRMYFAVTGNTNSALGGANRLLFAMSDDGGLTWKKANGTIIGPLPLRGIDNLPNTADVVEDSGTTNFFGAKPGLIIDKNGKPGISLDGKWRTWNGKAWTIDAKQNFGSYLTADTGYRLATNDLILNSNTFNKLLRTESFDSPSIGYDFIGYKGLNCLDDYGLRNSGSVYGIGTKADGSSESILKTTIEPAPLPLGWANQDIDKAGLPYGGNAGYTNGSLVMTSFGGGIGDASDSFHFVYKKMRANGTIVTKVGALEWANGLGGIMMRETLDPGAKFASILINANKSINTVWRSVVGAYAYGVNSPNIPAPYWVKLVRLGDVFTSFISPDGSTWTQTQSSTIPMNQDIYVGFALSANGHGWYMDAATFTNISLPENICDRANPFVSLSPTTQTGPAGGSVTFKATIVDNDSSLCPVTDFNLASLLPSGVSGSLDVTKMSLLPGATGNANLKISSVSTTSAGNYAFTVSASNGALSGQANGNYSVTNACVMSAPTISVSPSTKTTSGLTPVNYVVSILNNDTTACATRLFSFSTDTTNYYLRSWMEPYNIRLAPGKTATSLVTLTPADGLKPDSYTISTTTQNGGLGKMTLVYQAAQALSVKVSTDKPVYDRIATTYNAALFASVLLNNQPLINLPIAATLTWPDGTSQTINTTTGGGTRTFYQDIQKQSQVGIYNFSVTSTYQGKTIANNVMFSVR
jgi:hypothetical protein